MNLKIFTASGFGLMLLVLAAGCMQALQKAPPEQRYYMLAVESSPMKQRNVVNATLGVRPMRISPGYRSRHLLYRTGEQKYTTDYYNLFLDRPQDMITHAVRSWISQADVFSSVLPAGSSVEPEWLLEGNVISLYGDFSKDSPTAALKMEFFLLRLEELAYVPHWHKRYSVEKDITDNSASAVVQGVNQSLENLLKELQKDIDKFFEKRESK